MSDLRVDLKNIFTLSLWNSHILALNTLELKWIYLSGQLKYLSESLKGFLILSLNYQKPYKAVPHCTYIIGGSKKKSGSKIVLFQKMIQMQSDWKNRNCTYFSKIWTIFENSF